MFLAANTYLYLSDPIAGLLPINTLSKSTTNVQVLLPSGTATFKRTYSLLASQYSLILLLSGIVTASIALTLEVNVIVTSPRDFGSLAA